MALRFTAQDCTPKQLGDAKQLYGKGSVFACRLSPTGGKECIATSGGPPGEKHYGDGLQGCQDCTSACGPVHIGGKKPSPKVSPPDEQSDADHKGWNTTHVVAASVGGVALLGAIIAVVMLIMKKR